VCFSRVGIVAYLHHLAMGGALREAVAVIGAPDVAGRLAARLAEDAAVVRVIDDFDDGKFGTETSDALSELLEMARTGAVDTVVVVIDPAFASKAQPIVQHFKSVPIQVTICTDVDTPAITRRELRVLSRIPMAVVADRPLKRWDLLAKGIVDKGVGLILLALAVPLMAALALAVACDSPGPIIFRQRRSGWGGQLFTIYKFRTMRHAQSQCAPRQTSRNDPRCTRVGALLRRTSLDELPQLWNVMRGDMSLVGPRPHADTLHATECAACTVVAEYAQRQRVKPGLTGWAQINGARGAAPTVEMLRRRITYDLYYIDNWSIWFDVSIMIQTPWVMIRGENAF
jgi:exopolysaccharide biosynthesis polyprenyl glycosylphosphotransferase